MPGKWEKCAFCCSFGAPHTQPTNDKLIRFGSFESSSRIGISSDFSLCFRVRIHFYIVGVHREQVTINCCWSHREFYCSSCCCCCWFCCRWYEQTAIACIKSAGLFNEYNQAHKNPFAEDGKNRRNRKHVARSTSKYPPQSTRLLNVKCKQTHFITLHPNAGQIRDWNACGSIDKPTPHSTPAGIWAFSRFVRRTKVQNAQKESN